MLSLSPTLLASGLLIAFLHAALPTHWLPFVLVGRGQGWSRSRSLAVATGAGLCHVASTIAIAALLTYAGLAFEPALEGRLTFIVGAVMVGLGVFYIIRRHAHLGALPTGRSDKAAIAGLFILLTLSPCESILPLYVADLSSGWLGFAALSLVFAAGTVAAMLLFTGVSLAGAARLKLERLERYERLILGVILILLGAAVMAFER